MTAVEALRQARAAGVWVEVDEDDLVLTAPAPPPQSVVSALAEHKPTLLRLLRPGACGWTAEDWFAFFEERAAIAEFEAGLARDKAEARAFLCCVSEWLNRNPASCPPGRCLHCGGRECPGDVLLPHGTEVAGHVWLHSRCWSAWHAGRKAEARAALGAMGLSAPTKENA